MKKTQLLSDTKNLLYCKGKTHTIYKLNKNGLLNTAQIQGQVVSRNGKQEVFSMLHSWRQLPNKYTTDP